jgi:hypothetical protein
MDSNKPKTSHKANINKINGFKSNKNLEVIIVADANKKSYNEKKR